MSCKARLEIGWIEEDFQGETPEDIVREVGKVQDLDCLLRMGYEEEEAPNPEYMYDGIYCDEDLAVIEDITLQRINGKLHYLVITPGGTERVPCIDAAEEQFEKILKKHGAKLNDLTWEDLNKVIAGR